MFWKRCTWHLNKIIKQFYHLKPFKHSIPYELWIFYNNRFYILLRNTPVFDHYYTGCLKKKVGFVFRAIKFEGNRPPYQLDSRSTRLTRVIVIAWRYNKYFIFIITELCRSLNCDSSPATKPINSPLDKKKIYWGKTVQGLWYPGGTQ